MYNLLICKRTGAFVDAHEQRIIARPAGVPQLFIPLKEDLCGPDVGERRRSALSKFDPTDTDAELRSVLAYAKQRQHFGVVDTVFRNNIVRMREKAPVTEDNVREWLQRRIPDRDMALPALDTVQVVDAWHCGFCGAVFSRTADEATLACPRCAITDDALQACVAQTLLTDQSHARLYRVATGDRPESVVPQADRDMLRRLAAAVFDLGDYVSGGETADTALVSMGMLKSGILAAVPSGEDARTLLRACSRDPAEAAPHRSALLRAAVEGVMRDGEAAIKGLTPYQREMLCAATAQTRAEAPTLKPLQKPASTIKEYSAHVQAALSSALALCVAIKQDRRAHQVLPQHLVTALMKPGHSDGSIYKAAMGLEEVLLELQGLAPGIAQREAAAEAQRSVKQFSVALFLQDFSGFAGQQTDKPVVLALALLAMEDRGWNGQGDVPHRPAERVAREVKELKRFALQLGALHVHKYPQQTDFKAFAERVFAPASTGADSAYLDLLAVHRALREATAPVDDIFGVDLGDDSQLVYLYQHRVSLRWILRIGFQALAESFTAVTRLMQPAGADLVCVDFNALADGLGYTRAGHSFLASAANAAPLAQLRAVSAELGVAYARLGSAARRAFTADIGSLCKTVVVVLHIFATAPRGKDLVLRLANGANGEQRNIMAWGGTLALVLHNRKASAQKFSDDETVILLPWIVSTLLCNVIALRRADSELRRLFPLAGAEQPSSKNDDCDARFLLAGQRGGALSADRVSEILRDEWRARAGFPFQPKDLRGAFAIFQCLHDSPAADEARRSVLAMQQVDDLQAGHARATVDSNYCVASATPLRTLRNSSAAARANVEFLLSPVAGDAAVEDAFQPEENINAQLRHNAPHLLRGAGLVRRGAAFLAAALLGMDRFCARVQREDAEAAAAARAELEAARPVERNGRCEAGSLAREMDRLRTGAASPAADHESPLQRMPGSAPAVEEPELVLRQSYRDGYKNPGQRLLVETACQLLHPAGGTVFATFPTATGKTAVISTLAGLQRNRGRVLLVITTLLSQLLGIEALLRATGVRVTRYSTAKAARKNPRLLGPGVLTMQFETVDADAIAFAEQLAALGMLAAAVVDEVHIVRAHAGFRSSGKRVLELVRALRMREREPVHALLMTATVSRDDMLSIMGDLGPGYISVVGNDYREARAINVVVASDVRPQQIQSAVLECVQACEGTAMVFIENKAAVAEYVELLGNNALSITGEDDELTREEVLCRLGDADDDARVLVATSAAASGINVPRTGLVCVVVTEITTLYAVRQMVGRAARELGETGAAYLFVAEEPRDALLAKYMRFDGVPAEREAFAAHVMSGGDPADFSAPALTPTMLLPQRRARTFLHTPDDDAERQPFNDPLPRPSTSAFSPRSDQSQATESQATQSQTPTMRATTSPIICPPQLRTLTVSPLTLPPAAQHDAQPRKRRAVEGSNNNNNNNNNNHADQHAVALAAQHEFRDNNQQQQEARAQRLAQQDGEAQRVDAFIAELERAAVGTKLCARCVFLGAPPHECKHSSSSSRHCPSVRDGSVRGHKLPGDRACSRSPYCMADTLDCQVAAHCDFGTWKQRDYNCCATCWGRSDLLPEQHMGRTCLSPIKFIVPTVAALAYKELRHELAAALPDAAPHATEQRDFLQWAREVYVGKTTNGHRLLEWLQRRGVLNL